ncbi:MULTISPECIES: multidrug effflux MFS transporter [Brucella]|uniref:Bcr/CflA family efflux transporter n=4 Tax=Brucella TaxID=234 RepID=Q8YI40_BRUME|nr:MULTISPECIES: multidrug effflux MFS transporter [Brucella]AAL51786.1 bicyclomycin resistance protein [Brucella melitensis bv. 1 str. 16M]AIJ85305.1 drug resistance transporter, Bcr/CflA subfamily protein [Brucella melitensis bv. 3 str. Ether]AIJ90279.1 drug resistance transporter, Bcr/CflA subfamily protein [Brucella melitensis bv. 1 str. 16M]EEW86531.1 drug resistance transporter Bcr/CflA subfamily [Brucella melitensis bv. 1 str. 16M]EEZ12199.1 drug resistance transporter [Brucella meliten
MASSLVRNAIVLGLLSAIGPFAIDMYLPALPTIATDLRAETGAVQMSLLAFFLALALAQLFCGPLSDMVGRKLPLYGGLVLFAIGSIGSALAANIDVLVLFRFIQGLGAAAGMVIPRAIVRDLHTGVEAARLMSLLMLVFSISPILAPLTGSIIISFFGWRGVFWAVLLAAGIGIILVATAQKETRSVEARLESNISSALRGYGRLLKDRHFLGLVFVGGFGLASLFVYLANSAFVLIDHYGLTPIQYAVAFSANAVSFFGVSQLNGWLGARFGLGRVMRFAACGFAAAMLAMFAAALMGHQSTLVGRKLPLCRLRLPWAGYSSYGGAGARRTRRDCRNGICIDGHASLRHWWRGDWYCRSLFRWHGAADDWRHHRLCAGGVRAGADRPCPQVEKARQSNGGSLIFRGNEVEASVARCLRTPP